MSMTAYTFLLIAALAAITYVVAEYVQGMAPAGGAL